MHLAAESHVDRSIQEPVYLFKLIYLVLSLCSSKQEITGQT